MFINMYILLHKINQRDDGDSDDTENKENIICRPVHTYSM